MDMTSGGSQPMDMKSGGSSSSPDTMSSGSASPDKGTGSAGGSPDITSQVNAIEQQAQAMDQQMSQDLTQYKGQPTLDQMTGAKDVNVAAFTIGKTGSVTGSGLDSQTMATISNEISSTVADSIDQQNRIDSRNSLTRAIFGGDRQAASSLLQDASVYETEIGKLQQILSSGTVNPAMRPVIMQEIQVLQNEHDRLTSIATVESQNRGILGFLGS